MKMPVRDFAELIEYAISQETETKLYNRWLMAGQHMNYEDFKRELTPPQFKSEKAVLDDVEKILNGGCHGSF